MENKTIFISGSTDGIGKETALELANQGHFIIIHGRNEDKIKQTVQQIKNTTGNKNLRAFAADFSSLEQVKTLAETIRQKVPRIDVFINNAGTFQKNRKESEDGHELTLAVNYLAPFALTVSLIPYFRKSAPMRIVNVASMAHASYLDFDNLQSEKSFEGYEAYSRSKLCDIIFTFELADLLENTGITVNCLHPGVIDTKLLHAGGFGGGASPEEGAENIMHAALNPQWEGVSGRYFRDKQETRPAEICYNREVRRKLWQISEELTGVSMVKE